MANLNQGNNKPFWFKLYFIRSLIVLTETLRQGQDSKKDRQFDRDSRKRQRETERKRKREREQEKDLIKEC